VQYVGSEGPRHRRGADDGGGCSDYGNDQTTTPSATVPAQLALTLGTPASFGAFRPGLGKT
jgi:hypothetical protein